VLPLVLLALSNCTDDPTPTGPGGGALPRAVTTSALITTVTNTNNDGPGSLRVAIELVAPDGGTIRFADAIAGQTITLQSPLIVSNKSLTIEGSATDGMTLSGGGTTLVLFVAPDGVLVLRNVTVSDGFAAQLGGGINNAGELTLDHVTVAGNKVGGTGDSDGNGGGIFTSGPVLSLMNSTVSGNWAEFGGGGIYSPGSASIELIHSTVAFNAAGHGGGGVEPHSSSLSVTSTIIANNTGVAGGEDCLLGAGPTGMTLMNLFSTASCFTDLAIVADPMLAPLADNGGPTPTHALLAGSPAIDAVPTPGCFLADVDQRYVVRPQGWRCDLGAFEFTDFPSITIGIDASGPVNPNTGAAIVSGTMTCPVAGVYELQVELTQPQKLGRVQVVAHASASTTLSCDGTRYWSVSLFPPSGGFKNGPSTASAKTSPPSDQSAPYVIPGAAAGEVKLYWARK